ncbi:MAG: hypothetical protein QG578_1574, partial [Thermodesulfobacteriota bacterium]|nr:hypothetical protein [Thermodesulfobacteriota bacterium]
MNLIFTFTFNESDKYEIGRAS